MAGATSRGRKGELYAYYKCQSKCKTRIRQDYVEEKVFGILDYLIQHVDDEKLRSVFKTAKQIAENYTKQLNTAIQNSKLELKQLEEEKQAHINAISRIDDQGIIRELNAKLMFNKLNRLRVQKYLNDIEQLLTKLKADIFPELIETYDVKKDLSSLNTDGKRTLLMSLIKKITVKKDKSIEYEFGSKDIADLLGVQKSLNFFHTNKITVI